MDDAQCGSCGAILSEPAEEQRSPCPLCGSTTRQFANALQDGLGFMEHLRSKGRQAGSNKVAFDVRSGASYYRKGDVWHHLVRSIDRVNNRYTETITVLRTGELVSKVDEPLSEHTGHGSAKDRGETGEP